MQDQSNPYETSYRNLAENLPAIIYRIYLRENNRVEFFNKALNSITGYAQEELMRDGYCPLSSLVLSEDLQSIQAKIADAVNTMRSFEVEYRICCKDGSEKFLLERGKAMNGTDGQPLWVDGAISDQTENKALRESWQRYAFIVNTSREFYTLIRRGYIYEAVNDSYCKAHNKKRENIINHSVEEIWGKQVFTSIKPYFDSCFAGEEVHYQMDFEFPAIGRRSFEVAYYPYFDSARAVSHVVVVSRDVSERVMVEEDRDRLAIAIEQTGEMVVITGPDGIVQYVNPAFEKQTGFCSLEIVGQKIGIIKSGKHDAAFYANLWKTILSGNVWRGTMVNCRRDGQEFHDSTTISPVKDSHGKIIHFVAVKRDITREVVQERNLIHSQKMQAIGTLAGGIAHDFNNILSAIQGFTELISMQIPESAQIEEELQQILTGCSRAHELVSQILTFSRQKEQKRQALSLQKIVTEVLKLISSTIPKTIEIISNIQDFPETISADSTQMHQVVMNLCTNAFQAIAGKRGTINVSVECKELDVEEAARLHPIQPGKTVILSVQDSGIGMDSKTVSRIFEPYFTTKLTGEGTGLGLSLVHGIVTDHEGIILVDSAPGNGTKFSIYFSCNREIGTEKEPPVFKPQTGTGCILFLDDEPSLVKLGTKSLGLLGYTVVGFTESLKALEAFKADPDRFDLVITDYMMPKLTGLEFAAEIRKVRPQKPILVCSGNDSGPLSRSCLDSLNILNLLRKPVKLSDLAKEIQKAIKHV